MNEMPRADVKTPLDDGIEFGKEPVSLKCPGRGMKAIVSMNHYTNEGKVGSDLTARISNAKVVNM